MSGIPPLYSMVEDSGIPEHELRNLQSRFLVPLEIA
jgi:hypothetical protein